MSGYYVEPAKEKFRTIGGLIILLTGYWIMARVFMYYFLMLEFVFWDTIPFIVVAILTSYFFWVGPLRSKLRAQTQVDTMDMYDSIILRPKKKPKPKMLGFKEVYECKFDFEDNVELSIRLKSQLYQYYLYRLTLQQMKVFEDKDREIPEEIRKHLESLEEILKDITEMIPKQEDSKTSKEKLIAMTKAFEQETTEILAPYKKEVLPFKEFNLDEIDKDKKFIEDLKILKQLKCYYVKMYAKEHFEDEKEEWDEIFILTPGEFSEVLKTHKDEVPFSDWYVNGNVCFCTWMYLWLVTKNLPVFLLKSSENIDSFGFEKLSNIGVKAAALLQLKVMNIWMNDLEIRPEKLDKDNKFLKAKLGTFEEGFGWVVKDQANMDLKFSQFYENKTQQDLLRKIEKYKRKLYLVLFSLILILICGGILFSFLI